MGLLEGDEGSRRHPRCVFVVPVSKKFLALNSILLNCQHFRLTWIISQQPMVGGL